MLKTVNDPKLLNDIKNIFKKNYSQEGALGNIKLDPLDFFLFGCSSSSNAGKYLSKKYITLIKSYEN